MGRRRRGVCKVVEHHILRNLTMVDEGGFGLARGVGGKG